MKKLLLFLVMLLFSLSVVNASSLVSSETGATGFFDWSYSGPNVQYIGFGLISPVNTLTGIEVELSKVGSGGGNLNLQVYDVDGSDDPQTLIATSNNSFTAGSIGTTKAYYNFTFSDVTLNASQRYAYLVYSDSLGGGADYYRIYTDTGASVNWLYACEGSATTCKVWSPDTSYRTNYYMYGYNASTTPAITSNLSDGGFYNYTNINVSLTTTSNTNMSYVFNGGNETSICNDCNSSYVSLTGVEGLNNITWISTDGAGQVNTSETFNVDTVNPSVTVSAFEFNNGYNLNFSNYFNYSDTNLDSCTVTVNGTTFNCGSNHTMSFNGNFTYTVFVNDSAGNSNTSSANAYINPYQYFYFYDTTDNAFITNFTFFNTVWDTYAEIKVYDIFGSNNINFSKFGYLPQTFSITTNLTSAINNTYNTSQSFINVNIYDIDSLALITGVNFSLEFVSEVGLLTWTNTGTANINNILFTDSSYRLIVSNGLYESSSVFFDFTNQENITLNVYMLNATNPNAGSVAIRVVDRFSQPLNGIFVKSLQWDSSTSSYTSVSEAKTANNGIGIVNVLLDEKLYKFRATDGSTLVESDDQIVQSSITEDNPITLVLSSVVTEQNFILQDLVRTITEVFSNSTNISDVTFNWESTKNINYTVCLHSFRKLANTDLKLTNDTANCMSGTSGTLERSFLINSSFDSVIKAQVKYDGAYITLQEFDHFATNSLSTILENLNLQYFLLIVIYASCIAGGFFIARQTSSTEGLMVGVFSMGLASILSLTLVSSVLTSGIAVFFFLVGVVTIIGGSKQ